MQHLKHYASIITMLMLLLQITFTSCGEGEDDGLITNGGNTTCLVSVKYSEGGTATTSDAQVMPGWEVTLTATPDEGYRFVNWTVNGVEVSKENPYTLAITTSTQFKANFEKTYTISVSSGEGGTATTSDTEVMSGWEVTLTAIPEKEYRFVNWTVNGEEVSKDNPYTTTITASTQFKANFEKTYTISVSSGEGGTAKTSKTQVGYNGQVTLTAIPNEGYGFVNWTVNGVEVSTQNPYTTTITEDVEYKANFISFKPTGMENGKGYVDLGLSVKWATCNVGATTHEEYGDYFAWGETTPKTTYNWSAYKYCNGTYDTMTKYCTVSYYGTVDNKTTLELTDDAAHVNWGGSWRMPTLAEQDELRNNCTWKWTTQNGVNGYRGTSKKNGNSIFLPAEGSRYGSDLHGAGGYGYYWSSSLYTSYGSEYAYALRFNSSYADWNYGGRCNGHSVRPVCE